MPALPDVPLSLVLSVATAVAEMSTESSIIDLLYDMLDQQPGSVYILERIVEAWESKNERGMMNLISEGNENYSSLPALVHTY